MTRHAIGCALASALFLFFATPIRSETADAVVVNGEPLPPQKVMALQQIYGPIRPGNYWYDPFSGLWGLVGGPTLGQIMPGHDIGGPLRADASAGDTNVFINGRQLHLQEVLYLQRLGPVLPGRYWMNAQGIGGYEGGPPIFNIGAAVAARRGQAGQPGWNVSGHGGHLLSDGNCSFFMDPKSGSSVGNC